jgi:hypothetical protein
MSMNIKSPQQMVSLLQSLDILIIKNHVELRAWNVVKKNDRITAGMHTKKELE